jgi:hypothetical protein
MTRFESTAPLACALAAAFLCGAPGSVWAQRNGDVYDFRSHEPTPGEVRSRERAAGTAPSEAESRRETDAVEQLYQKLMREERAAGTSNEPAGPRAPSAPPASGAPPATASAPQPRQ